jgi:hypothetical protein
MALAGPGCVRSTMEMDRHCEQLYRRLRRLRVDLGSFDPEPSGRVWARGPLTGEARQQPASVPRGRVRLACTARKAWRRDRGRAIVLQQVGSDDSRTHYPLVEFVETDEPGRFASPIPDRDRPRALLTEGTALPERFRDATVERAYEVFRTIDNGPSLRLLVEQDDEVEMVRHSYWVARLRGRI